MTMKSGVSRRSAGALTKIQWSVKISKQQSPTKDHNGRITQMPPPQRGV